MSEESLEDRSESSQALGLTRLLRGSTETDPEEETPVCGGGHVLDDLPSCDPRDRVFPISEQDFHLERRLLPCRGLHREPIRGGRDLCVRERGREGITKMMKMKKMMKKQIQGRPPETHETSDLPDLGDADEDSICEGRNHEAGASAREEASIRQFVHSFIQ